METQRRIALDPQGDYTALLENDGSLLIQACQEDKGQVHLTAEQAYNLFVWPYEYHRATSPQFTEHPEPEQGLPGHLRHGLDTETASRRSHEDWASAGVGEVQRCCFALDEGTVHASHCSCYVDGRNVPCSLRNTI
jgi:hypothetical protein